MRTTNNVNIEGEFLIQSLIKRLNCRDIGIIIIVFLMGIGQTYGQAPDWEYSGNYGISMTITLTVADECLPSADPNDIIGAFDINGVVRGVAQTNIGTEAFLTIGGIANGEAIYFKVYDASKGQVHNIHGYTIPFASGARLGPLVLNFDSDSQNTSGGMDQWVVDTTSTNLEALGTGTWSLISGGGGNISDPSNPNTIFTGNIGTSYLLAWTLSDAAGCIGETDEVSVTFAAAQAENTPERCADGVDNDGNGLTDCQEIACGKPVLNNVSKTDPTALTCSTETPNGSIMITQTGATLFSIDNGMTTQASTLFTGLPVGDYKVWMQDGFAGCTVTADISLINTLNAAPPVAAFAIMGPSTICLGNDDVNYSIDKTLNGNIAWTYTGAEATISASGIASNIDFGDTATAGTLTAVMTNTCSSNSASLEIGIGNPFICRMFSNCPDNSSITNALLESTGAPQVYRAGINLTSDANLKDYNYEFTAGNSISFDSEFSIASGLNFVADIKNCTK